ncbi:hypothetical protein RRG08_059217 [Elysia crispata]|uniref:Uncharacterized protein n=1 Tax=Elysia crispata TaxID=231223 RepID=A0AAE0ZEC9_9GAST|nr:hypothetical protein RRG08_059217 [Elysia crispata]
MEAIEPCTNGSHMEEATNNHTLPISSDPLYTKTTASAPYADIANHESHDTLSFKPSDQQEHNNNNNNNNNSSSSSDGSNSISSANGASSNHEEQLQRKRTSLKQDDKSKLESIGSASTVADQGSSVSTQSCLWYKWISGHLV